MTKQVRISDENAEWLGLQGGSLSAAADRTLGWAREAMEAIEAVDDEHADLDEHAEPVDSYPPAPAGDRPATRRGTVRTSSRAASAARFAAAARRPW